MCREGGTSRSGNNVQKTTHTMSAAPSAADLRPCSSLNRRVTNAMRARSGGIGTDGSSGRCATKVPVPAGDERDPAQVLRVHAEILSPTGLLCKLNPGRLRKLESGSWKLEVGDWCAKRDPAPSA